MKQLYFVLSQVLKLLPYVIDEKDKHKLSRWMKGCLNEYLRYASRIVNLEYYYFEYEGNKRSRREMIDLLFERVLNFNEMIDIWKVIYEVMRW